MRVHYCAAPGAPTVTLDIRLKGPFDTHNRCQEAVTTCFRDFGLSWQEFEHRTFHMQGSFSNQLCHRRSVSEE